jgi:hypothetical protein
MLDAVQANLTYLDRQSESPSFIVGAPGEASRRIGQYSDVPTRIANARLLNPSPTIDDYGFELVEHRTRDVDFARDDAIEADYYPQAVRLFRDLTGAAEVIIFDHTVRTDGSEDGVRRPARHVHNDYTPASTIKRVIDVVGGDEAVKHLKLRYMQVNLWRPIGNPVRRSPLAIADARSIARDHYVKADIVYPDRRGEVYEVIAHPGHRWFYYPDMQTDEALVFRGFDTAHVEDHPFTRRAAAHEHRTARTRLLSPREPPRIHGDHAQCPIVCTSILTARISSCA